MSNFDGLFFSHAKTIVECAHRLSELGSMAKQSEQLQAELKQIEDNQVQCHSNLVTVEQASQAVENRVREFLLLARNKLGEELRVSTDPDLNLTSFQINSLFDNAIKRVHLLESEAKKLPEWQAIDAEAKKRVEIVNKLHLLQQQHQTVKNSLDKIQRSIRDYFGKDVPVKAIEQHISLFQMMESIFTQADKIFYEPKKALTTPSSESIPDAVGYENSHISPMAAGLVPLTIQRVPAGPFGVADGLASSAIESRLAIPAQTAGSASPRDLGVGQASAAIVTTAAGSGAAGSASPIDLSVVHPIPAAIALAVKGSRSGSTSSVLIRTAESASPMNLSIGQASAAAISATAVGSRAAGSASPMDLSVVHTSPSAIARAAKGSGSGSTPSVLTRTAGAASPVDLSVNQASAAVISTKTVFPESSGFGPTSPMNRADEDETIARSLTAASILIGRTSGSMNSPVTSGFVGTELAGAETDPVPLMFGAGAGATLSFLASVAADSQTDKTKKRKATEEAGGSPGKKQKVQLERFKPKPSEVVARNSLLNALWHNPEALRKELSTYEFSMPFLKAIMSGEQDTHKLSQLAKATGKTPEEILSTRIKDFTVIEILIILGKVDICASFETILGPINSKFSAIDSSISPIQLMALIPEFNCELANRVIPLFIKMGYFVGKKEWRGLSPIHLAASKAHTFIIFALLEATSLEMRNLRDEEGNTPLHRLLLSNGNNANVLESIKLFINAGVDLGTINNAGQNCCHIVVASCFLEALKRFKERLGTSFGNYLSVADINQRNCLDIAKLLPAGSDKNSVLSYVRQYKS